MTYKRTFATLLAVLLLAGCGGSNAQSSTGTGTGGNLKTYSVILPEGGSVLCVVYSAGSKGGVSCDWDGAQA